MDKLGSLGQTSLSEVEDSKWVACGEFADVSLGTWRGQLVAVKQLKEQYRGHERSNSDFAAEKSILERLPITPNVVKILATGNEAGLPFMILERLGDTLTKRTYSYRLPFTRIFDYAKQLAKSMKHLHCDGLEGYTIMHRDLKPDNIMFGVGDAEETLKLVDFGLVCVANDENKTVEQAGKEIPKQATPDATGTETLFDLTGRTGSLRYMAPEVMSHKPYNEKNEVYSWAIIVWEMTARERPYSMLAPDFIVNYVVDKEYRPDTVKNSKIRSAWPPEFLQLVTRAWGNNISARPKFEEIVAELEKIEASGAVVDKPGCACVIS